MVDVYTFRAHFPELAAATDSVIEYYAEIAEHLVGARFGEIRAHVTELIVAHYIALFGLVAGSTGDATLGPASGIVASKSVGKASVSYDTDALTPPDSGTQFNSTVYGRQYQSLARIYGAGAVCV